MLPLQARGYLGATAIKKNSAFPKAPALLELHHQIVYFPIQDILLYCHLQHHNDTIIKMHAGRPLYKYIPLTLFVMFEKGYSRFTYERDLETEQKLQYSDPHSYGRQRCVFLVLLMLNRRPWCSLCWVLAFFTATYPQTPSGFPRAPSAGCGFLYHISSITPSPTGTGTVWLPSWLSYIIVQHPLDRPLDLWNRMFDRHQAEITLMQFTGHSLPVRQSMSVPWEFFTSSHFISQFPPTRFPLITAIRMSHFLPVHHLGMAFFARVGSKYNNSLEDGSYPSAEMQSLYSAAPDDWAMQIRRYIIIILSSTEDC